MEEVSSDGLSVTYYGAKADDIAVFVFGEVVCGGIILVGKETQKVA